MEEHGDDDAEQQHRDQLRRLGPHHRDAGEEDEDARDGREAGLEQDRREHEGRVGDAGAAGGEHARGGRPDAARDVLRQHRDHLGLERVAVGEPDPPRREDPDPPDHEEQVVRGERGEREHEVADVGGRDPVAGVVPRVADEVRERRQQDDGHDHLDRDDEPTAAGKALQTRPHPVEATASRASAS
jgi:hypothetical protein